MGFQGKVHATRVAIASRFPIADTLSDVACLKCGEWRVEACSRWRVQVDEWSMFVLNSGT